MEIDLSKFQKKMTVSPEHISTIIGAGTSFKGDLDVQGGIRVDGALYGELKATGKLAVGENGDVQSQKIDCLAAVIGGSVAGELTAPELVKLESNATFTGTITTKVLIVEQGAVFNGNTRMERRKEG